MGGRGSASGKAGNSYIEAKSYDEVDRLENKLMDNNWLNNEMTSDEANAIYKYTTSWHSGANEMLRKDKFDKMTDANKATVENISKGIAKYNLKENVIAFRGADTGIFGADFNTNTMHDWVGGTLQDKGFMSTSISKKIADGFEDDVLFKVKVPKGSKAAYVANNSNFSSERELLIDRNSSFKINKITHNGKRYEVEITLMK